ncbi:MAG: pentapeptide repeat-containing protein [Caldilineaceae bacterium]
MNEERMQILQMLQDGKISVDEATRLLEAAEKPTTASSFTASRPKLARPVADAGDDDDAEEPTPKHGRGIRLRWAILENMHFTGANLQGADFAGQDLQGFDFTGANLRGANFQGANCAGIVLTGANLRSANLRDINLTGADLTGANLSGADLRNADLSNASLTGAALRNTALDGANLSGADLTGIDLRGYKLRDGVFTEMEEAEVTGSRENGPQASKTVMGDMVQI